MKVWVLAGIMLAVVALPPIGTSADECNPYPIGRCGAYQRESVIFCYILQGGRMVSGTDPDALAIGPPDDVPVNAGVINYVRTAPVQSFLDDPMNAPLPSHSVWQESNNVAGLQPQSVTCSRFVWYAECDSWMGPYNPLAAGPDKALA